jgi:putative tryptophan/tyrosine transport system substrate-binding protein
MRGPFRWAQNCGSAPSPAALRASTSPRAAGRGDIRRRSFLTLLGGAAAWPLAAHAQQASVPVIGFLLPSSPEGYTRHVSGFRQGLSEAGYNEGHNVAIEYRWAEGHYDRLPAMAADLVRRNVAVIVAAALPPTFAAKQATDTVPIVFEAGADPVRLGLVASLNRPGGNITGIVNLSNTLVVKRVELMHEVVPNAQTLAVLLNPDNQNFQALQDDVRGAQKSLAVDIAFLQARTLDEIDAAFAKAVELRAGGLIIGADPYFNSKGLEIAAVAKRYNLPASFDVSEFAAAGGLMSYGADLFDAYRLAGIYAVRILKGEKPAELPVQQSTKVEMTINLKSAKALGLTISLPLLGRADEVIE